MDNLLHLLLGKVAILTAVAVIAVTSSTPVGATGICNDNTYTYAQNHRGACSHHGGVAQWL